MKVGEGESWWREAKERRERRGKEGRVRRVREGRRAGGEERKGGGSGVDAVLRVAGGGDVVLQRQGNVVCWWEETGSGCHALVWLCHREACGGGVSRGVNGDIRGGGGRFGQHW